MTSPQEIMSTPPPAPPAAVRQRASKHVGLGFESNCTGNGNLSFGNSKPSATSYTMARPFEARSSEGDDKSRIVGSPILIERPGQSSRDLCTRNSTGDWAPDHTREFGEQQLSQNKREASPLHAISAGPYNTAPVPAAAASSTLTTDSIRSSLVPSGASGYRVVGTGDRGMAGQSWVSSGAHTTLQENSHEGNQPKRTEQASRETLLDPTTHHKYNIHTRTQDNKTHTTPSIALAALSQPLPPAHAATAAEIALGISSPYNSLKETRSTNRSLVSQVENTDMNANATSLNRSLCEGKDRDEESTSRTSETGVATSTGRMTPLNSSSDHGNLDQPRSMAGTPSTVSTAPSTDDASLGTDYKLDDSLLPHLLQESLGGLQGQAWSEESLLPGMAMFGGGGAMDQPGGSWPPQPTPTQQKWAGPQPSRPLVASFRQEASSLEVHNQRYQPPPTAEHFSNQGWNNQTGHQTIHSNRMYGSDPLAHYHSNQGRSMPIEMRPQGFHQPGFAAYQQGGRKQGFNPGHPHGSNSTISSASLTPPRNPRNARQQGQLNPRQVPTSNAAGSPHQSNSNPQRSSSEILKTLLRKKACLYEPDTSRAVALVTWLVGRELALEYGFFSRQQLQSGVHACVSDKIDSGIITRTKVNRCMQIILNSCFHYIIPRSDGTEEKGDSFRRSFASSVEDDSFLLQYLPAPWNDLSVSRAVVVEAAFEEEEKTGSLEKHQNTARNFSTPKSSPKLSSLTPERSPGKDSTDGDAAESKRAVLLCFNENVRSAEDVFRCHNEFIRDTANAAQLQLTAQEWRTFFGREAARAPYLWGNVAIPIATGDSHGGTPRQPDVLGQMCQEEVGKFRSSWCTKRYDHDHDLCGFAHVEVNGGWLRRNPLVHRYMDKMCQFISTGGDQGIGAGYFFVNECPHGIGCEYAHSTEEVVYHPKRYKSKVCSALFTRAMGCNLGDVCPNLHPPDPNRPVKKPTENRQHPSRHPRKQEQANVNLKSASTVPASAPVVYASPAPFSSFERQLSMPGLQSLYRRQSSVVRAHVRNAGKCRCIYSCFGDDQGIYHSTPKPGPVGAPGQGTS